MQSEEKLSPSYTGDKKHLCPRKHSLEVTQEEVQDEELRTGERDYTALQSVEETPCEPLAITRVRPVEQGCLKRPMTRKIGRQESIEELDKEKLKSKMVVKRQDWSERRESLQKQDALWESDSSPSCGEDRDEGFVVRGPNKPQVSPEPGPLEVKAASSTLKDVLYKKLNTRASEGVTEPAGGGSDCDGGLRSALCSMHPEWQHPRPGKDNMKPDRLDFKAPNIEFTRKRLSFEEREDCICRLSSGIHENLHFGSTRSKSLQLDTVISHDHVKVGLGSVHSSPEGLAPKLFSGRGESAVEKLQLISSAESPLRKTSSEYKLEGRHVSSLKPLEGTLDIGFLSGPRVSKTESCLSKVPDNTSDTPVSPPVWLQSPTERQITIPQLKAADKLKSPLYNSPNPDALNNTVVSKDQSNHASTEVKVGTSGEKTQERHNESSKVPTNKVETSTCAVKQESRTGMKASSPLAHEHRAPRHSSHFSSCGKTPSIREVSNEDQEDEWEQQEVPAHTTSQPADSCSTGSLTLAKLEVEKSSPAPAEAPTLAAVVSEPPPVSLQPSVNSGLDTGQVQGCGSKREIAQNSNMTSISKVKVQDTVLSKQLELNICSLNTDPVCITASASGSVRFKSDGSDVKVIGDTDSKEFDTCAATEQEEANLKVGQKKQVTSLKNETEVTPSVKRKEITVSVGVIKSNSVSVRKKDDPVSPKLKIKGSEKDPEQLIKHCPAEKAQLSDSESCTSKREETVCVKENTVVPPEKQRSSTSVSANENVLSPESKLVPEPEPVAPAALKAEETKIFEGKSLSAAVVKCSPNLKQRDLSKPSVLSASNLKVTTAAKHKDASLPHSGADVKLEESVQSSPPSADVKKKEIQTKSSVAGPTHVGKELKPKSPPPKTSLSSAALKTSIAASPAPAAKLNLDAKHKDSSPKNQASVIKDVASHQLQQLLPSRAPCLPAPPPVLPKPALRKEMHPLSAVAISGPVVKAPMDSPRPEAATPDSRRGPDARTNSPDKQVACSRKEPAERKKPSQEITCAQKNTKRDASRAAPSAPKDSSKDGSRCRQKESPRSSNNAK